MAFEPTFIEQYRQSATIDVAIVGATGAVGETMLEILMERNFPIGQLYLLASERSVGTRLPYKSSYIAVQNLAEFDFSQVQVALFSAGGSISAEYAPKATAQGCVVIDNTSHFRYETDVPLIIPEVNVDALPGYLQTGVIANPNCSTIQMLVALKPLHDAAKIKRINVATYQAVSGTGKSAISELASQTASLLSGKEAEQNVYPKQIAFNVLPQIDSFQPNGYTREEMKMVWETQKILGDESLCVNPTCVRVPVFYGHSEAVHLEFEQPLSAEAASALLQAAPGVTVLDDIDQPGGFATPVTEAAGKDATFVSRIRKDISSPNGLNLWVVSDNVRKGAALNSVQIAEALITLIS